MTDKVCPTKYPVMFRSMTLIISFVISNCYLNTVLAQNFTGEIIKESRYIAKNNTIDIDSIKNADFGDVSRYIIKPGYYKLQYYKNNEPGYSYTYHPDTQMMYDDHPDKKYITYRNSKRGGDYSYEEPVIHRDSTITLFGNKCYLVTQKTSYGLTKTYYSDNIRIDYESFKDHEVGNWYNKLKFTDGAISLKSIVEYADYIEVNETVSIVYGDVKDIVFKLPENKKVVASFSALDEKVTLAQPTLEVINCYQKLVSDNQKLIQTSNLKTIYTMFIVTETGEITDIDVYEKDNVGLYKKAVEFIQNCGIAFTPGKINGKPVASEVYFPIEF